MTDDKEGGRQSSCVFGSNTEMMESDALLSTKDQISAIKW